MHLPLRAFWLYPGLVLLAFIFYWVLPADNYIHPDSSYLHARYAQNLLDGNGLVYNPGKPILLTSAALPILGQALEGLPTGEINHPSTLIPLLLMAVALAAFIRLMNKTDPPLWLIAGAVAIWLPFLWLPSGSIELWLAALVLVALDLADAGYWRWAGLVSGLTFLVTPTAVIFILLIGILAMREQQNRYWQTVWLPGGVWVAFALFYYGWNRLQGLTLPGTGGAGFLGLLPITILIPLLIWFRYIDREWQPALLLVVIGSLIYSLIALLLNFQDSAVLIMLAMVLAGVTAFEMPIPVHHRQGLPRLDGFTWMVLATAILIGSAAYGLTRYKAVKQPDLPELVGSKGYYGDYQDAFLLGNAVHHLGGVNDPHLYNLAQSGDAAAILIATAPDYLLSPAGALTGDPGFALLNYQNIEDNLWQRMTETGEWETAQPVNLDFSPHVTLTDVTLDQTQIEAGGILRLRLDWVLEKAPTQPMNLIINVLDMNQTSHGSTQQSFPPEKWETLSTTTYHVLPINSDALPGLYNIVLGIDYNAALLNQFTIAQVKIPVSSDQQFDQPPIAQFGEGRADLMAAEISQTENQINIDLIWRADGTFDQDYKVFIHMTPPDDVMPVRQAEQIPLNGRYPTSIWEPGEVIEDTLTIDVTDVPPGDYVLRLGMYQPESGVRLKDDSGGETFVIGEVTRE